MSVPRNAVILLSGGLDSATVLAQARSQGYACYALSFDYGQRHRSSSTRLRASPRCWVRPSTACRDLIWRCSAARH
jgi:preQ(0) biosynthesis protein QueC